MSRVVFLVLGIFLLPLSAAGQDRLNVLYTGAIKGELEPCGCSPETQSGGLARLSGYVKANRDKLDPFVLVDAGNSLAEDTPQGRLKSEALLKSFAVIGYDAAAFFRKGAPASVGLLLSGPGAMVNAVSDMGGQRGSVTVERGRRVNISVDPDGGKKGMFNILLTDRPPSDGFAGWDIVVSSSGHALEEPLKADGPIIVSGYPKGQRLGILTLEFDGSGGLSGYSHRWQALGGDIREDGEVRKALKEYDEKVAGLAGAEEMDTAHDGPYLGAAGCVDCHQPFYESWEKTRHAGAFGTIEKAGKSRDPECVVCHSTGYKEEGGFQGVAATPGLAGVQCEACHGPGREHVLDLRPMRPVDGPICLKCHTGTNSPGFEYGRYLDRIKH